MKKFLLMISCIFIIGCSNNQPEKNINLEKNKPKIENKNTEVPKNYIQDISVAEAILTARERNLDLEIKRLESEISTLDRKIAFSNFLPSINFGGGYTKLDDDINIGVNTYGLGSQFRLPDILGMRAVDKSFYTYGINAQIPVFVPSTWYLYSARKKGENISQIVEELADKMLQLQVMGEYYYILALESEQEALKNQLKSAKEFQRKAEVSLKVGSVLPWELEKAKTLVATKEFLLNKNQRDLYIAKIALKRTLNMDMSIDIRLENIDSNIKKLSSLDECIYKAINQNEKLIITEEQKNIGEDIKKIAISNFLPKIVLGGGYENNSNEILMDSDFLYGNVSGIVSIFNGFRNINEYKKAVRNQKIGELKLEKEYMTTILETAKAYKNVENAQEILKIANMNFDSEKGKLKQKKTEKEVDLIDNEEYYKALADYEKAFSDREKAKYQYEMAVGTLKIVMGENPFEEEVK